MSRRYYPIPGKATNGLRFQDITRFRKLSVSPNFTAPVYIDSTSYCIPTSNQGNEPACAGYATAGLKEILNWITTHQQVQFDGLADYRKAKELDNDGQDGTTLEQAVKAGIALGWFPTDAQLVTISTAQELKFALHSHRACIGGFKCTEGWSYLDNEYYIDGMRPTVLGGHAVLICYYDEKGVGFQNSWDVTWGKNGFGRIKWEDFDAQFIYAVVVAGVDSRSLALPV